MLFSLTNEKQKQGTMYVVSFIGHSGYNIALGLEHKEMQSLPFSLIQCQSHFSNCSLIDFKTIGSLYYYHLELGNHNLGIFQILFL